MWDCIPFGALHPEESIHHADDVRGRVFDVLGRVLDREARAAIGLIELLKERNDLLYIPLSDTMPKSLN